MKFNSYIWNMYKESVAGKEAIELFDMTDGDSMFREQLDKYNPLVRSTVQDISFLDHAIEAAFCNLYDCNKPKSMEETRSLYESTLCYGIFDGGEHIIGFNDYDMMLDANMVISYAFYYYVPDYCFPNLFKCQFYSLKKTADLFELELPPIPKKSDYKARCMYYMDLCELFYKFRIENNLSPAELCAFLYDFAPNLVEKTSSVIPKPTQAWFIGGLIDEIDKMSGCQFWQANAETRKGDILIHYETSPISAITHIWIAQTDGVIDPFFHYYSNVYIDGGTQIPNISLKELKKDAYFSIHPLVRKNFQGVNGWQITNNDYIELLRLIKAKGGDIEQLPKLYAPNSASDENIHLEKDVEEKLLEPLMKNLGITPNDYSRQVATQAGRRSKVFPDYALFYEDKQGSQSAQILIEAKLLMKSNKDIEEAFLQAVSYAKLLESSTVILCDKVCLYIYSKKESFDRDRYTKYYWEDINNNPDVFRCMQNIIKKR